MSSLCRHLHLELCKISREIVSIFGIQMTLKMGCYFGFMTTNLYELFNVIFNNSVINNKIYTCIQITWFSHNVFKLFFVNYVYEKVSQKVSNLSSLKIFNECYTCMETIK